MVLPVQCQAVLLPGHSRGVAALMEVQVTAVALPSGHCRGFGLRASSLPGHCRGVGSPELRENSVAERYGDIIIKVNGCLSFEAILHEVHTKVILKITAILLLSMPCLT